MRFLRDESGQVLVMTLVCMGVLLGALGLAIDVGLLFHARRNMQTAADAAAMAAATELYYNGVTNVNAKAYAAAKANGVDNTVAANTVMVTPSPTLPGGFACASCVEVQLAKPNPTIFMQMLGRVMFHQSSNYSSINVSAMAVAGAPGAQQNCMFVMDPHASSSLWIHGAGSINAPNCGVYVNSDDPGALCVTGNAGKSTFSQVDVHGGQGSGNCKGDPGPPVYLNGGVESLPAAWQGIPSDPRANCPSVTDTASLTGTVAGPGYGNYQCYANGTCTATTTTKKGVTTTTVSCNPVTVSSATLGAGIYVFETGVKITGATTIGGPGATAGATVIVAGNSSTGNLDGGVYDSGTATTFYDYAPQSGTYNGIAIYQPSGDTQQLTLQFGSGSSIFSGAVVAPGAAVDLHDQGGAVNATVLVVGQAYINGKVNLTNYSTYNPITTPLKHISLVE
ncbi:MAG TPA: pilus assembly protein TadG-related protein [Terracidiphilus sp.]